MLALARFSLKGPFQAASVVGLLAVLAVFLPLMAPSNPVGVLLAAICMLMSCVLVGLIILTQGSVSGLQAIGAAIFGITLVAWVLVNAPQVGLWTAAMQWLPIILLAQTLRSTKSLALTLLAGLALGALAIGVQYLVFSDLEEAWIREAVQRMGQLEQLEQSVVERNIQLVRLFVLALVAMSYLMMVLIVLTARWMQAKLADSKGFGAEFRALSLGKIPAAIALLLMLASFAVQQAWLNSLVFLAVAGFMFQGIAVVHYKLHTRRQARLLLVLFYVLLLVFPQVAALAALTGMIDNWLVFRRVPAKPDDENET